MTQAQVNPINIHVSRNTKVGYLQRAKATLWIVVNWELGLEPFQFSSLLKNLHNTRWFLSWVFRITNLVA
jgi:hypothetical protein